MTRLLAILFLTTPAFAGDKIEIPEQPKPAAVSNAAATADAVSASNSYSNSASSSNSNSGGNVLAVNESNPRQTPGMAQGSFAIQGCAVAGNAGGSNVGGTGFLGFAFTPSQCYDYMLAQAYAALDERQAACLVLNSTKAAKRAEKRGVTLPTCTPTQPAVPTQSASTAPKESVERCVTGEHLDRVVKACAGSK